MKACIKTWKYMDIENARLFALGLGQATEKLFAENWISFCIAGKWFMLIQLDAPEPRIAVKLPPDMGEQLREQYNGVKPAYHMNKRHWNDLYLNSDLTDDTVRELIRTAFETVVAKLPKKIRTGIITNNN